MANSITLGPVAPHLRRVEPTASNGNGLLNLNPSCVFCGESIDPTGDCWVGHREMAHTSCAWAADEALWVVMDAEREEKGIATNADAQRA